MNLATSFDENPKDYQKFRQSYPEELIDYIVEKSNLIKDAKILDVGAGTGKASEQFAIRGFKPTLLEPGKNMLDEAKKNLETYGLKYINEYFEKANLEKYDLIISAQAFHWVKRPEGYEKVVDILKEDGTIAFFWNCVDRKQSEFLRKTEKLYLKHCPEYKRSLIYDAVDEMMETDIIKEQEKKVYNRVIDFTKESYLNMICTFSWVSSLEGEKLKEFTKDFNEFLNTYEEPLKVPYQTILIIAKKYSQN